MDYEGNTKKRKRSSSADTAGFRSGGKYQVFLSLRGKDTCKTFTDYEGNRKKRKGSSSADTAGSSSSASALASGGKYQVFLSFSGKDTRKTFTDYLYQDLVGAGIRTFRDDDKLPVGERIGPALLKAIQESKICIPIFSRGYASSKWCLRELAWMVHCGKQILPIFYDVTPGDVRYQTGSYEEAFRRHQNDFDQEIVQGWKDALRVVGGMKGWELEKETKGHEGELVKIVVLKVLLELKKTNMVLPKNLVGIEQHVQKIKRLVKVSSNDVRIVGIHGICGIGKTTIAKFIYNDLSEFFECRCFLEDVGKSSKHNNGLFDLQKQFISKMLKMNCPNIRDVDDGINTIKGSIYQKKVLIVLDDINEESQFENLVGDPKCLGLGSRIIVTTRNKDVLNILQVDGTYEPPFMKLCHSRKLFNKHVFKRDTPPKGYDILSESIVSIAAGLPLAVMAIGMSLFNKKKEVWEEKLMQLKDKLDDNVYKELRTSYDDLNVSQKQIFLDIACLFIGEDKRLPFYMWHDCKFYPIWEVKKLQLKSLVKIEDDKWLRMHDQLRDLGRQIVREEEKPSRLFVNEDALNVLWSQIGIKKVEAICVNACNSDEDFTNKVFRKLSKLRFLRVDYADLVGDFKHLLSNLRWLQWHKCPGKSAPTNFHLQNLVILDLSNNCYLKDDWEVWSQIKRATKLKVLNLSGCNSLTRTPDFSTFTALEILNLGMCKNLVEVGEINHCKKLIEIQSFWMLKELKLHKCQKLAKVEGLGVLKSLEILDTTWCTSLERLDLSNLKNLKELRIRDCKNLTEIQGLEELESLGFLDMAGCKLIEKLPNLSNLKKLEILIAFFCEKLTEIRGLEELKSLKLLDISGCKSIERLLDLSNTRIDKNSRTFLLPQRRLGGLESNQDG